MYDLAATATAFENNIFYPTSSSSPIAKRSSPLIRPLSAPILRPIAMKPNTATSTYLAIVGNSSSVNNANHQLVSPSSTISDQSYSVVGTVKSKPHQHILDTYRHSPSSAFRLTAINDRTEEPVDNRFPPIQVPSDQHRLPPFVGGRKTVIPEGYRSVPAGINALPGSYLSNNNINDDFNNNLNNNLNNNNINSNNNNNLIASNIINQAIIAAATPDPNGQNFYQSNPGIRGKNPPFQQQLQSRQVASNDPQQSRPPYDLSGSAGSNINHLPTLNNSNYLDTSSGSAMNSFANLPNGSQQSSPIASLTGSRHQSMMMTPSMTHSMTTSVSNPFIRPSTIDETMDNHQMLLLQQHLQQGIRRNSISTGHINEAAALTFNAEFDDNATNNNANGNASNKNNTNVHNNNNNRVEDDSDKNNINLPVNNNNNNSTTSYSSVIAQSLQQNPTSASIVINNPNPNLGSFDQRYFIQQQQGFGSISTSTANTNLLHNQSQQSPLDITYNPSNNPNNNSSFINNSNMIKPAASGSPYRSSNLQSAVKINYDIDTNAIGIVGAASSNLVNINSNPLASNQQSQPQQQGGLVTSSSSTDTQQPANATAMRQFGSQQAAGRSVAFAQNLSKFQPSSHLYSLQSIESVSASSSNITEKNAPLDSSNTGPSKGPCHPASTSSSSSSFVSPHDVDVNNNDNSNFEDNNSTRYSESNQKNIEQQQQQQNQSNANYTTADSEYSIYPYPSMQQFFMGSNGNFIERELEAMQNMASMGIGNPNNQRMPMRRSSSSMASGNASREFSPYQQHQNQNHQLTYNQGHQGQGETSQTGRRTSYNEGMRSGGSSMIANRDGLASLGASMSTSSSMSGFPSSGPRASNSVSGAGAGTVTFGDPGLLDPNHPPKENMIRFHGDQYTPRFVKGKGREKQGLCPHCPKPSWFTMKNSAYWYHLQFTHGISASTCLPFRDPSQMKLEFGKPHGYCGECRSWVLMSHKVRNSSDEIQKTMWFRHVYKCGNESGGRNPCNPAPVINNDTDLTATSRTRTVNEGASMILGAAQVVDAADNNTILSVNSNIKNDTSSNSSSISVGRNDLLLQNQQTNAPNNVNNSRGNSNSNGPHDLTPAGLALMEAVASLDRAEEEAKKPPQ